jgi:hypothetical protein
MTISFNLKLKYDNTSNQSIRRAQEKISSSLAEAQRKGELDILSNATTIHLHNIVKNDLKLVCPSRTIASFHTLSCGE